jgi:diamine N-acetyltransferase
MPIALEPLTGYDARLAEIYLKWFNDSEIAYRIAPFGGLPATPESCAEWMGDLTKSMIERRFTILLEAENYRPIGDCGLTFIDYLREEAGVSIFIADKSLRGQRLGQLALKRLLNYAFNDLELQTLYLTTDADYPVAVGAYTAVGFKPISVSDMTLPDSSPYRQMTMELKKTKEF